MGSKIEIPKICQHCGKEFIAKTTVTQFCGQKCAAKSYRQRMKSKKVEAVSSVSIQKKDYSLNQFQDKEYLSISEVCQLLGASRMTIYRQIKNGNINAIKLGRRTIIRKSDIEKLFTAGNE